MPFPASDLRLCPLVETRQRGARLQANRAFDDLIARAREPVDANQIDARLVCPVPGVERAKRVVRYESRGCKQLDGVLIRRIARQRRGCEVRGFGPATLENANTRQLAERRIARTRDRRCKRALGSVQIVLLGLPHAFRDLLIARRCGPLDSRFALARDVGRHWRCWPRAQWRGDDEHPATGGAPALVEVRGAGDAERCTRGIVEHDAVRIARDDDDVVIGAGMVFDERDDGTALLELARERVAGPVDGDRVPRPRAKIRGERVRSDTAGLAIDERLECVGVDPALTPVAHHHRGCGAPAQQFRLGDEGDVEQRERLRAGGRRKKDERKRDQPRAHERNPGLVQHATAPGSARSTRADQ